jgi:hypothetical protein
VEQKEQKPSSSFGFSLRDLAEQASAAIIRFLPKPGKVNLLLIDKAIAGIHKLMDPIAIPLLNTANFNRYKDGTKLKNNGGYRQARAEVRRDILAFLLGILPYANVTPQGIFALSPTARDSMRAWASKESPRGLV